MTTKIRRTTSRNLWLSNEFNSTASVTLVDCHEAYRYFKIGCMTKTKDEWLRDFEAIGKEENYGKNIQLYGDVIKLFSQYDLEEKESGNEKQIMQ